MAASDKINIIGNIRKFALLAGVAGFIAAREGILNACICGFIGAASGYALGKGLVGAVLTKEYLSEIASAIAPKQLPKKWLTVEHSVLLLLVPVLIYVGPFQQDRPLFIFGGYGLVVVCTLLNLIAVVRIALCRRG